MVGMQTLGRRLAAAVNPALVLAFVAVTIAVTGGAFAAVEKNQVTTESIKHGAVTSKKIRNDNVRSADIADGAVGNAQLSDGSVSTTKLTDGSITTSKIANGAVGLDALSNDAKDETVGVGPVTYASSFDPSNPFPHIVQPAATITVAAKCPAGTKAIGGGQDAQVADGSDEARILMSRPNVSPGDTPPGSGEAANSWIARVYNGSTTLFTFEVYAVCAK